MALSMWKSCHLFRACSQSQIIRCYGKKHAAIFQLTLKTNNNVPEQVLITPRSKSQNLRSAGALTLPTRCLQTSSSSKLSGPFRSASSKEPSKETLIYNGPLSTMVRLIKFFSLSTSIISSGLLAALCMANDGGVMTYIAGGMSSLMIFTPLILHWFTKGYITRMYFDFPTKTYTACTYDFFLTDKTMDFTQSDVSLPSVTSAVSSFAIRGKPMLVDPRGFLNPNHYSHLMGYTDTQGNLSAEEAKRAFESSSGNS